MSKKSTYQTNSPQFRLWAICLVCFLNGYPLFSQSPQNNLGNWGMGFNQTRVNEKCSFHSEFQYRSYEITPNTEQLLLRVGINYHVNNQAIFSLGYGSISNYAFDKNLLPEVQIHENRIWQQFILRNNLNRLYFEHRYRIEQRWMESSKSLKYLDRIRYLLRITLPINNTEIKKNTFFLTIYDELFIHLSSIPFDRNRLYSGVGFQLNSHINIQIGHLWQTINNTTKKYLQTAVFFNIDLRKK